jgi:hypothetical protein
LELVSKHDNHIPRGKVVTAFGSNRGARFSYVLPDENAYYCSKTLAAFRS